MSESNTSNIGTISIQEILDKKYQFFIPSYQRGYRWTEQQVEDLLNDVNEFEPKDLPYSEEKTWYCLQPLVVKKMEETDSRLPEGNRNGWYEVIDGQQRLTTIFIILFFLKDKRYTLSYETRKDFREFLKEIDSDTNSIDNIDEANTKFNDIVRKEKKWDNEGVS